LQRQNQDQSQGRSRSVYPEAYTHPPLVTFW